MKRIEGKNGYYGICHPLPPVDDRPNQDTIASFERWLLYLPGQHACWNRYALCGATLRDFPGVPPAKKHYEEATHEVCLFAIDPNFPQENFDKGGIQILEPINYCFQLTTTDANFRNILEKLAEMFVQGQLPADPEGIRFGNKTAREYVHELTKSWSS